MPAKLILTINNQKLGVDLVDGVYRVGRQKPADVVIPDATMSGNHAELQIKGNSCMVRDLGSTNGTFVNGKQVRAATPVTASDELRFGGIIVELQFPAAVQPVSDVPSAPSAAAVQMQAVKVAASRLSWTLRYWLAGAYAILFLLLLFFFVLYYAENSASQVRLRARYHTFASQYIHPLKGSQTGPIPAPVLDDSLTEPIIVANREGNVLYPAPLPGTTPPQSPLIDPKSTPPNQVYEGSKYDLFVLPRTKEEGKDAARSFPVRVGGDLVGYVVGRPAEVNDSPLGFLLPMLMVASFISLLVLYFTLRPVNAMMRSSLKNLTDKLSPLVNGFIEELPRDPKVGEVNELANEIEKAVSLAKTEAAGAGGRRKQTSEYAPLVSDLADSAKLPYCFISGDFKLLHANRELSSIQELARASIGDSIFDTGMTAVQSKQLVQAIAEARSGTDASVNITLSRRGSASPHDIRVRSFQEPGTRAQMYGIIFNSGMP